MDNKTAIEIANREIKITENCNTERLKELNSAWKISKEALEKQVPKKVTYEGFCPNCKMQYPMYPPQLNKYCSNCGQKLDWD